jgi:hypothetical protein
MVALNIIGSHSKERLWGTFRPLLVERWGQSNKYRQNYVE